MSLRWVSLRWVSLCWVSLCWVPLCWVPCFYNIKLNVILLSIVMLSVVILSRCTFIWTFYFTTGWELTCDHLFNPSLPLIFSSSPCVFYLFWDILDFFLWWITTFWWIATLIIMIWRITILRFNEILTIFWYWDFLVNASFYLI